MKIVMNPVSLLSQVDLFRGLHTEQLNQILAIAQIERFDTGAFVCRQGEPAEKLYIVIQGQVEVLLRASNGIEQPVLYLGEGQVVGEMTLVDEGRRSASVLAMEDEVLLYSIPNLAFNDLCHTNTAIGFVIMRNIAQDLSFKLRHRDFDPNVDSAGVEEED